MGSPHSASGKHLFRDELCAIADSDENIAIDFVGGREEVAERVSAYIGEFGNKAYYYVSGPPGMVTSMSLLLDDRYILEGRVVLEAFTGYK